MALCLLSSWKLQPRWGQMSTTESHHSLCKIITTFNHDLKNSVISKEQRQWYNISGKESTQWLVGGTEGEEGEMLGWSGVCLSSWEQWKV